MRTAQVARILSMTKGDLLGDKFSAIVLRNVLLVILCLAFVEGRDVSLSVLGGLTDRHTRADVFRGLHRDYGRFVLPTL